jgi:hypothetical protein
VGTWAGDIRPVESTGWDEVQRRALHSMIESRQPFLDFTLSRAKPDGSIQQFRISGEPMFNTACRFLGYRGVGLEISPKH